MTRPVSRKLAHKHSPLADHQLVGSWQATQVIPNHHRKGLPCDHNQINDILTTPASLIPKPSNNGNVSAMGGSQLEWTKRLSHCLSSKVVAVAVLATYAFCPKPRLRETRSYQDMLEFICPFWKCGIFCMGSI